MVQTLDLAGEDLIVNSLTTGVATPGTALSTGSSSLSTIFLTTGNIGTLSSNAATVGTLSSPNISANSATISQLHIESGTKLVTALSSNSNTVSVLTTKLAGMVYLNSSGAVTQNQSGAGGVFILTMNNASVASSDQCFASVGYVPGDGASANGNPTIASIAPSAGALVITVVNTATAAGTCFSGHLAISYVIFKN